MQLPDASGIDDHELVLYLLGLLPDERARRLDEASIADDELAAQVRIAERDLVDAYVRGALSGDLRARFESHYLATPHRRGLVACASRFLRAVDRQASSADTPARSGAQELPASPLARVTLTRRT